MPQNLCSRSGVSVMGVTLARPPADRRPSEPRGKPPESGVAAMLKGHRVCLRPVREADLDSASDAHLNLESRGEFFPQGVVSVTWSAAHRPQGRWDVTDAVL